MNQRQYYSTIKRIEHKHPGIWDLCEELVLRDHDCDQNTCSIAVANREGHSIHALECLLGSGAASEELLEAAEPIPDKDLQALSRYEADSLCKTVPHVDCPHCNAVLWYPEECNYFCDSCARDIPRGGAQ